MKKISIIIPVKDEEKYIADCIDSVLANDYPHEFIEIFIIDGLSKDRTIEIVQSYAEKNTAIKIFVNKDGTVPFALNMGIGKATGEYIIRLDAHASIPKNYFSELIKSNEKYDADNIGTCCITDVINHNPKTNAIIKVLSNKFGVGNSFFRIGITEPRKVDTVPFGCYKKAIFEKAGLFNTHLSRNQDIELNKRIVRSGGKIILIPDVSSTYYARETFSAISKNNYATGKWNVLTVYVTKKLSSLSLRHFIPLLFLLSLIVPIIGMFCFTALGMISLTSLFLYLILVLKESIKLNDSTTNLFYLIASFIVIHFSYALGSLSGLVRINYLFKHE